MVRCVYCRKETTGLFCDEWCRDEWIDQQNNPPTQWALYKRIVESLPPLKLADWFGDNLIEPEEDEIMIVNEKCESHPLASPKKVIFKPDTTGLEEMWENLKFEITDFAQTPTLLAYIDSMVASGLTIPGQFESSYDLREVLFGAFHDFGECEPDEIDDNLIKEIKSIFRDLVKYLDERFPAVQNPR